MAFACCYKTNKIMWKYYSINVDSSKVYGYDLDEKLNEYGSQGWELVSLFPTNKNKDFITYIFKKHI